MNKVVKSLMVPTNTSECSLIKNSELIRKLEQFLIKISGPSSAKAWPK